MAINSSDLTTEGSTVGPSFLEVERSSEQLHSRLLRHSCMGVVSPYPSSGSAVVCKLFFNEENHCNMRSGCRWRLELVVLKCGGYKSSKREGSRGGEKAVMNMDVVWFVCGALRTTKLDWARGQGHAQVRWKLSPPLLRGTLSGRHPLQSPTLVRKRRTLVFSVLMQ